jgi:hypothetical protein
MRREKRTTTKTKGDRDEEKEGSGIHFGQVLVVLKRKEGNRRKDPGRDQGDVAKVITGGVVTSKTVELEIEPVSNRKDPFPPGNGERVSYRGGLDNL